MTDLIARLTAATEGSAELDAEVLRAAGWILSDDGEYWINYRFQDALRASLNYLTSPTHSLDAIVGLIEAEGWEWFKDRPLHYDTGTVLDGHAPIFYVGERGGHEGTQHPSAPIALCLAFLRAKAAATPTEEPDNG